MLFFFNLIPISPLDGWAVLKGFLAPCRHTATDTSWRRSSGTDR